ncbi:MAG: hypothetical protein ACR2L3_00435 [Actinomycetota bacterium]
MALRNKARKLDPDAIYICFDGFAGDVEGAPMAVKEGTKLRGDHPAVLAHPAMFVGPDPDDAQVAAAKRAAYAEAFAAGNASRQSNPEPSMVAKPIPPEHQRVVARDFISPGSRGSGYGLILHAGEVVDSRSAVVRELSKTEKTLFKKV